MTQVLDLQLDEVLVSHRPTDDLRGLNPRGYQRAQTVLARSRKAFAGNAIWHVNTSAADGVAEMLRSLLGYTRAGGVDARWLVASTPADFGALSRRLYNNLYGMPGDGELGSSERQLYDEVTSAYGRELCARVCPGDVVYLHDPPLAGLVPTVQAVGAKAIWRCHLGLERPNEHSRRASEFLQPYLEDVDACVFSREVYAWEGLDRARTRAIYPSIDPFSPKNQRLDEEAVAAICNRIGLTETGTDAPRTYTRFDGSPGRVDESAAIVQDQPVPDKAPVIAQVSGWERMKDQGGLMLAFSQSATAENAHLVLAGPSAADAPPDSEECEVLAALIEQRAELPGSVRERIHLVEIPTEDRDDNAAIVNAVQRRADVIAHKPRQEGFGLSVTEAMWKARPVVATRVGGIVEQIIDGESGVLVDDPDDLSGFAASVGDLLADPDRRRALGAAARQRVAERFSVIDHLAEYLELIESLRGSESPEVR